ncbi:TetR/AcrR family transcriptional regulator [Salinirubrum litoreum]|uniref:TetR/AcrR family transcriptional regulator n=1 Tax=Salinirubrum litoreum TaxID=1126234 RepID=A0ABD5RFU9_9EURY|nr:TetR/AcrR family transcriptional regulator [Salinirubrum litoreum]
MDSDTKREIIDATGRALCAHGYADLTMQRIAERSSLTTAAIHYHFDTKDDLLDAFLDDLLDRFEARLACEAVDPRERLATFLDAVFTPSSAAENGADADASGDDGADEFPVALMELKGQAPYHDRFRERFRALDEVMRAVVREAVDDGVEAGHFADADPEAVARLVVTVINGAHVRTVALGEDPSATRAVVESVLDRRLGWTPSAGERSAVADGSGSDPDDEDETRDAEVSP